MFWRKRRERDLERELRSDLDLEAEEQRERGLSPEDARYAARRAFGNSTFINEEVREMWGFQWFDRLASDLRYGCRALKNNPGFAAVAILSLGLGIGANAAIFNLLNALVLRLLPVNHPEQLVQLTYTYPGNAPDNWNSWFDYPQLERFRGASHTLSGIFGGVGLGRVNVGFGAATGIAEGDAYTDNFFRVLGVAPQAGRLFLPGDDREGASVVVLSDRYWRNRFAADPAVVGQTVTINQLSFTVIGIAPVEFSGIYPGGARDLWVPLRALDRFNPSPKRWQETFSSWLLIAGRLAPEVPIARAQAELDAIHRQLLAEQLDASQSRASQSLQRLVRESRLVLLPAGNGIFNNLRHTYSFPLELLMGVAGIVLLISCANVANLALARGSRRSREIAVRIALGAGRSRLIRQLLTESLLLAAAGGVAALAIAWWGGAAMVHMISTGDGPAPLDVRPGWPIFGYTAAVSLATGILFGLAPAFRGSQIGPASALKQGVRSLTARSRFLDRALVVVQVAMSLVLIAGAGLFARTLHNLWAVNVGYQRDNVLLFSVDAKLAGYPKEKAGALYRRILEKVAAMPAVQSASVSMVRPVDDQYYLVNGIREVDGRKLPERDIIRVAWNGMSPGYFATIGTPILLGRDFDFREGSPGSRSVIVNETLAHRAFPGQNPVGHRLNGEEIIGVVKDSLYNGARDPARSVLYRALFQADGTMDPNVAIASGVSFELRYRPGPSPVEDTRLAVLSADPGVSIFRVKTLRAQAEDSLVRERLLATVSGSFGGLALLLAMLGLYGLMSYAVAQRTAEMGIRMALGARRERIVWMTLRETLWLAGAGIALGVPMALWLSRYAKALLFGVAAVDPVTLAGAVGALAATAALAGYLPARRASRVDPMVALRYE
jgi:putative ABC transport system permease protein